MKPATLPPPYRHLTLNIFINLSVNLYKPLSLSLSLSLYLYLTLLVKNIEEYQKEKKTNNVFFVFWVMS